MSIDWNVRLKRRLPFSKDTYDLDLREFFGKGVIDFEQVLRSFLKGKNVYAHLIEKFDVLRKENKITQETLNNFYKDEAYLAHNVVYTQVGDDLPVDISLDNEYEFLESAYQYAIDHHRGVNALDHGAGTGWQGLLLWRLGYDVTFCDLATPYFEFLQFRCKKYNMEDVDFITIDNLLDLKNKFYDYVNSFFVFEHILHPISTLQEVTTHMKYGALMNLRADFAGEGMHLLENNILHPDCSPNLWEMILHNYGLKRSEKYTVNIFEKVSFI